MGKLIKNHWARLIILTAAAYQAVAGIQGFFWPKIFWDFLTKNLDVAVKPFPALQIMNLVLGIVIFAWEWPLQPLVKLLPGLHRSFEARLVIYPVAALAGALQYQATNAAIYYIIGVIVYFVAYSEGEVRHVTSLPEVMFADNAPSQTVCAEPWTVSKRDGNRPGKV
jgi:hypothetical protein